MNCKVFSREFFLRKELVALKNHINMWFVQVGGGGEKKNLVSDSTAVRK